MPRILKVAAAQVGAVDRDADRAETLARLIALLDQAASEKVQLLLYPEVTFTTFFPRHLFTSSSDLNAYFEHNDDLTTSPSTAPLFSKAQNYGIDIVVGFAERTDEGKGYNTCVYYSAAVGKVINKYRKVHLPGTVEPFEDPEAVNQLEKRYFTPGDLGFPAFRAPGLLPTSSGDPVLGMLICNDRRWPEAWRSYALQGAELLLIGYNTVAHSPHLWGTTKPMTEEEAEKEALFHSRLVQQSNSYMNSVFSISSARCGLDDGKYNLIGGSAIINPEGHVVAEAKTKDDELVVAEIDLEECRQGREKTFDFGRHRRIEAYGRIGAQTGVVEPELL
ncbi:carbon-nitrogen hydrolase [Aureobasidium pullulans EXF-150]|uniref:Carbon-nitrogen hydrolase n=1 Tax=Aureobasidium pullulans EXF-150 TaxID=1043002 RepID=A0A074XD65_AURPU|nr:carbon-nitrogen hydrolase [Aureobasidium pullulans EXF-150]KEQ79982.1 carbon-nitrogen hydrolase [Aureobasidium pullulans EXF-150]